MEVLLTTESDKSTTCNSGNTDKFYINNRRYLGNKFKLVEAIRRIIDENCENVRTFVDIFAGTGSVASGFCDKKLILNDILYSNHICHVAWFSSEDWSETKVLRLINEYNIKTEFEPNYMSQTFSNTYFSEYDCKKIGFIREDIENKFLKGDLNYREYALLITSLIYAMDKIANTVGHYDAYRKGTEFRNHLILKLPSPPVCEANNECYNEDANVLVSKLRKVDVFFMDPPYNSRQYSDAYHLLENVAKWDKPAVKGVALKMDRSSIKSNYCTAKAEQVFTELVDKIKARYIVLTYNNMENNGNERSNAKLSDSFILHTLQAKGTVKVFSFKHKSFTAGKSNRDDNSERVFICNCNNKKSQFIESPLNYIGGKARILSQILPHFPRKINTFVDLFCGGANVGINVVANKVILQDNCSQLMDLYQSMKYIQPEKFISEVDSMIKRFSLSDSSQYGYSYYSCNSSSGLGKVNKDKYLQLRAYYSSLQDKSNLKSIALYVLIVFGFNNQIRFNKYGEFNLPVGKRDFNTNMRNKVLCFMRELQSRYFELSNADFRQLDISRLSDKDFVYADPPYLISNATYNEKGGWRQKDEKDLLELLDKIAEKGCKFALSNVIENKGQYNEILCDWLKCNTHRYRVIPIKMDYSNSNYHRSSNGITKEILVVNL